MQLSRGLEARDLAETLIGGLSPHEFPTASTGTMLEMVRDAAGVARYLAAAAANTSTPVTRHCWIYGGVTLNPLLAGAARRDDPNDDRSTSSIRASPEG